LSEQFDIATEQLGYNGNCRLNSILPLKNEDNGYCRLNIILPMENEDNGYCRLNYYIATGKRG